MKHQKTPVHSNKKVAESRGAEWQTKLRKGKFEARFNPTRLAVQRLKLNMNQNDLATKLGMSPATYGSIERAKRPVNQQRAQAIAKAIGVSSQKLFTQGKKNKMLATSVSAR